MTHERSAALDALLRRIGGDEQFIGSALAATGLTDEAALADRLGCPPENLSRLALCLRPDDATDRFAEEVRRIAAFTGCDPVRLRDLLREASAAARLRGPAGGTDVGQGLLLAARDREPRLDAEGTSTDTPGAV